MYIEDAERTRKSASSQMNMEGVRFALRKLGTSRLFSDYYILHMTDYRALRHASVMATGGSENEPSRILFAIQRFAA